jgi:hypothetical protein
MLRYREFNLLQSKEGRADGQLLRAAVALPSSAVCYYYLIFFCHCHSNDSHSQAQGWNQMTLPCGAIALPLISHGCCLHFDKYQPHYEPILCQGSPPKFPQSPRSCKCNTVILTLFAWSSLCFGGPSTPSPLGHPSHTVNNWIVNTYSTGLC